MHRGSEPANAGTVAYYDAHAPGFAASTWGADMAVHREAFLRHVPAGGRILDAGCGSGRDALAFHRAGYLVDAFDASAGMVAEARALTGLAVHQRAFADVTEVAAYDGIWCSASLLHLPWNALRDAVGRLVKALRPDGVLWMSFKYGEFDGIRNGRWFTDITEARAERLIAGLPVAVLSVDISSDVRPGRATEQWCNVLLRQR